VLILKVVKVLFFDTLLQVLILKVVSQGPMRCRLEAGDASDGNHRSVNARTLKKGCGTPPYFCASIPVTRNSSRYLFATRPFPNYYADTTDFLKELREALNDYSDLNPTTEMHS
jgi:hypothetical protein